MTPDLMRPNTPAGAHPEPTARLVSRALRRAQRQRFQDAIRAEQVSQVAASDVLAEETLPQLAARSLWLFVIAAAVYAAFIGVARQWVNAGQRLSDGPLWQRITLLIALNVAGYILMIPAHEAVHALVILALGGRPQFGLKLPLAAYCTAPNQLFMRNGYIAVALAPLIGLSLMAMLVAALAPNLAAVLLLAVAGNVSGAVGDLEVVRAIRAQPSDTLIADTATGYIAYRLKQ